MKIVKIINYIVFTGIAVLLLYLVFYKTDFNMLGANLAKANYYWVGLALILAFIGYIVRAYRWKILIEPLGYKPSLTNTYHGVAIGYFANIAIPRIGEITRCGTLNKTDKIPVDKLLATIIVERAVDVITLLLLLVVLLIAKFSFFGHFFNTSVMQPLLSHFDLSRVPLAVIIIVVAAIVAAISTLFFFKEFIKKIKPVHKTYTFAKGILKAVFSALKMKRKWEFIFLSLLLWGVYWLTTYILFFSISATSHLSMLDGLFILVAGGLGQAAPVQNGFGVYHGIVASALTLYGIDFNKDGLVYAIISHESQTLLMVLLGVISFLFVMFISRKNKQNATA